MDINDAIDLAWRLKRIIKLCEMTYSQAESVFTAQ